MGLSIRGYARLRGVSHTAVRRAIASGRIHPLADGTIDTTAADRDWAANTDESKPRSTVGRGAGAHPAASPERDDVPVTPPSNTAQSVTQFAVSRAIRESYQARLTKLEFEERSRTLVRADEVRVTVFNMARRARDVLLTIPDRISPLVAACSDAAECHKIIAGEIRKACEELHEDPLGRGSEEPQA